MADLPVSEYEASVDVTANSSRIINELIDLCEDLEFDFHLRDHSMLILLNCAVEDRNRLYAFLDSRRIEYTLPLFGG